ncbi:MAG: hypothetical protein ACREXI_07760, partial [Caldimonas sp.]
MALRFAIIAVRRLPSEPREFPHGRDAAVRQNRPMRRPCHLHPPAGLAALALALLLGACGGGGGGSDSISDSEPTETAIAWNPTPVTTSSIEGNEVVVDTVTSFSGTVAPGTTTVYIAAEADAAVVLAIDGEAGIDTVNLHVTMRGDLAPGAY